MKWKHEVLKKEGDRLLKLCVGLLLAGGVILLVGFKVEVCMAIGTIVAMFGAMVFIYLLGAQAADKDIAKMKDAATETPSAEQLKDIHGS